MTPFPSDVLTGSAACAALIPVCDHYCGVHARMVKSLSMQRDFSQEFGACVLTSRSTAKTAHPLAVSENTLR